MIDLTTVPTETKSYVVTPTCELRLNTFRHRTRPILEQAFSCTDGKSHWNEWRAVSFCETEHENNKNLPKDW